MDKIKQAAIKQDNKIWVGHRHGDIIQQMIKENYLPPASSSNDYGFITEGGEFLTREQAFHRALECKQISEKYNDPGSVPRLVSEMLY